MDHIKLLEFLGRMVGKAIYDSILIELRLAPFFLRKVSPLLEGAVSRFRVQRSRFSGCGREFGCGGLGSRVQATRQGAVLCCAVCAGEPAPMASLRTAVTCRLPSAEVM